MKERVAPCMYCGQMRVVQVPEGMPKEEEDRAATVEASKMCNCMLGQSARAKAEVLDLADEHIEQILRAEHPVSADMFQMMKEHVFDGRIQKLTIREGSGGKAEMKRTKSEISVSFEKTNKTELQT